MDLTVIICLYNAEPYIGETLDSLSKQTKKDFKLLIIDDCSTDNSASIANKYADKFTSFQLITFTENNGTAKTRNFALHEAETPFVLFFDADDIARPEYVEKFSRLLFRIY